MLIAARWHSSNTSLQYCYNSPRLLKLTYVQYIQTKLSKASEGAKIYVACCVTSSKSHTLHSSATVTTLASSHSTYNFQTQCHHIQCQENITPIMSPQSAKILVHIIVNVTTVITSTVATVHSSIMIVNIELFSQCNTTYRGYVNRCLKFVDVELIMAVMLSVLLPSKLEQTFDWY